jgi:hypothetical protein
MELSSDAYMMHIGSLSEAEWQQVRPALLSVPDALPWDKMRTNLNALLLGAARIRDVIAELELRDDDVRKVSADHT